MLNLKNQVTHRGFPNHNNVAEEKNRESHSNHAFDAKKNQKLEKALDKNKTCKEMAKEVK